MTTLELQKAFDYKFSMDYLNFRNFEQDTENWINTMKVSFEGEDYWINISTYEKDYSERLTAEELLEKINNDGWVLQDLNDEQKEDLEFVATPDVDPISETTYTCKNGYVMHMFFLQYYADKKMWYEIETTLKEMRGWYDKKSGGYMLRSRQDAERLMNIIDGRI